MKTSFRDILAEVDHGTLAKVVAKLPDWAGADLDFPSALCLEQCSSSVTAAHKARIAAGAGARIADLTGGLGADAYAFSKVASAVWYNERDGRLSAAVKSNFGKLGVGNVEFHSFDITPSEASSEGTPEWVRSLGAFAPDLIYLDPARRDAAGKKVFLLEDCSPDIVALWPLLLDIAPVVMVKLSPMADITMICRRLGDRVAEVHVVGYERECKELVCVLHREKCLECLICVDELSGSGPGHRAEPLVFSFGEENAADLRLLSSPESVPGLLQAPASALLFEPAPSLLKSGARKILCSRFGLVKLGTDTHLYLSLKDARGSGEDETLPPAGLFRAYRIVRAVPFSKAACREIAALYPHADVSARNFQMTSEALRSRLGVHSASSGGVHIFGVRIDFSSSGPSMPRSDKFLLVCEPMLTSAATTLL